MYFRFLKLSYYILKTKLEAREDGMADGIQNSDADGLVGFASRGSLHERGVLAGRPACHMLQQAGCFLCSCRL
jgi:hypothetical protein